LKELIKKITGNPLARDITILSVLVLLFTVPFLNQAFHWDDRDFIEQARATLANPLQFHIEDYSARGLFSNIYVFRHPPLLSYYLALFMRLGGESEPLLHGAYLVFPLMAAISMYSLARRFTSRPLLAAMLFIFTPGFLVMSHTIMGNLPGTAFWLLASALFIWGVDRRDMKLLVGSGIAMAAAIMVFSQALELAAILLIYAVLKLRFRLLRVAPAFIIPGVFYAAWRLYTTYHYGRPPAINYRVDFHPDLQIRAFLVFLGGSIIFPLSAWVVFFRRRIDLLVAFALLPPLVTWVAVYYISNGELTLTQGIQVATLAIAGFAIIYGLIAAASSDAWSLWKRKQGSIDSIFLLVWFVGVAAIYAGTTSLPYVAVRHMLPLFAPVVVIFVRAAGDLWPARPSLRSGFIIATLALTLAGGLLMSIADYRLANSYRVVAEQMRGRYAGNPVKVWSLGEFGFRYYMDRAGFEYLGVKSEASPGDIVVSSNVSATGVVAPLPEGFYRNIGTTEIEDDFPVRVMNPWAGAGFYGNLMGPLPFVFSTQKLDEITEDQLYWDATAVGNGG